MWTNTFLIANFYVESGIRTNICVVIRDEYYSIHLKILAGFFAVFASRKKVFNFWTYFWGDRVPFAFWLKVVITQDILFVKQIKEFLIISDLNVNELSIENESSHVLTVPNPMVQMVCQWLYSRSSLLSFLILSKHFLACVKKLNFLLIKKSHRSFHNQKRMRPINLLLIAGKIFKALISKTLVNFLETRSCWRSTLWLQALSFLWWSYLTENINLLDKQGETR